MATSGSRFDSGIRRLVIANAFSLGMLGGKSARLRCDALSDESAAYVLDDFARAGVPLHSVVGHQVTADLLAKFVRGCSWYTAVPMNRENYVIQPGDRVLVFQLVGRLPEGQVLTDLDGVPHQWYLVVPEVD